MPSLALLLKGLTLRDSGAGGGCRGIVVTLSWNCTNPMYRHRFPLGMLSQLLGWTYTGRRGRRGGGTAGAEQNRVGWGTPRGERVRPKPEAAGARPKRGGVGQVPGGAGPAPGRTPSP